MGWRRVLAGNDTRPRSGEPGRVPAFLAAALDASRPDHARLALAVGVAALSAAIQTLLLLTLGTLALALTSGTSREPLVFHAALTVDQLCWSALALTILALALAWPLARIQAQLGSRAVERARKTLIADFLQASRPYRLGHREGYFQQLVGEYCQHQSLLVTHLCTLAVAGVTMAGLIALPLLLHPQFAATALIGLAGSLLILLFWLWLPRRDVGRISRALTDLASTTAETVRTADEIAAYRVARPVEARLDARIEEASAAQFRIAIHDMFVPNAYQYGTLALILCAVAVVARFAPAAHFELTVTALLMIRLTGYSRQALGAIQQGVALLPHAQMIGREMRGLAANHADSGQVVECAFTGLCFENVDFTWPQGTRALTGVTLQISAGEAVGVAGPSGSGKSTLCLLAVGLERPVAGVVRINGIDVADLAPESWRKLLAHVPQECRIILGSIADNIRFFRDDLSDRDVIEAARAAHLHDEILALPHGFQTVIGPGSRDLSGGQRQRLAIARALAGRPGLLVLDEPSSALDRHSEALIVETLRALKGHTALLVIAHRPATLSFCDRVLAMQDGRLVPVEERAIPGQPRAAGDVVDWPATARNTRGARQA